MAQLGEGIALLGKGSTSKQGGGGRRPASRTRELEVGFFFDGTQNNEVNANHPARGGSYANAVTNVVMLKRLYPRDHQTRDGTRVDRQPEYFPGVGTANNQPDDLPDVITGAGDRGAAAQVHAGCVRLRQLARRGYDEIRIDVFGFSRGAAAARYFVNCIHAGRFAAEESMNLGGEPTTLGEVTLPDNVTVRFLGVFDTVAAILARNESQGQHGALSNADNDPINVHLRPGSAQEVTHIIAGDEWREGFALNSILGSGSLPPNWVEFEVPGAHSDIGGGYLGRGETIIPVAPHRLGDQTYPNAAAAQQGFTEYQLRFNAFRDRMVEEGYARNASEFSLRHHQLVPMGGGTYGLEAHGVWARPHVRTGLEKIALKIMWNQARGAGVPFPDYPNRRDYRVPSDLRYVFDYIVNERRLGSNMLANLRSSYIHFSAHYGREEGANARALAEAPAIAAMYPTDDEQRIVHPNRPSEAVAP